MTKLLPLSLLWNWAYDSKKFRQIFPLTSYHRPHWRPCLYNVLGQWEEKSTYVFMGFFFNNISMAFLFCEHKLFSFFEWRYSSRLFFLLLIEIWIIIPLRSFCLVSCSNINFYFRVVFIDHFFTYLQKERNLHYYSHCFYFFIFEISDLYALWI
jgi:hypothetical protein